MREVSSRWRKPLNKLTTIVEHITTPVTDDAHIDFTAKTISRFEIASDALTFRLEVLARHLRQMPVVYLNDIAIYVEKATELFKSASVLSFDKLDAKSVTIIISSIAKNPTLTIDETIMDIDNNSFDILEERVRKALGRKRKRASTAETASKRQEMYVEPENNVST
ncbi:MAG: hypothetical protein Q9163_000121 [Psora crenata]